MVDKTCRITTGTQTYRITSGTQVLVDEHFFVTYGHDMDGEPTGRSSELIALSNLDLRDELWQMNQVWTLRLREAVETHRTMKGSWQEFNVIGEEFVKWLIETTKVIEYKPRPNQTPTVFHVNEHCQIQH
jgi:hypothetical protein